MPERNVLVVGLGVSGISICEALAVNRIAGDTDIQITATDTKTADQLGIPDNVLQRLSQAGCRFVLGSNNVGDVSRFDEIIVSPGVPLQIPMLEKARLLGIPVVGELEWAWRYVNSPVIAVTGTNGKTTTTELIGSIMSRWGKKTFVGGNIGVPLTQAVMNGEQWDVMVLEVSSFQLDTAPSFSPDIFVVLNITEDHLDRYDSFDAYARSKISPILRQKPGQWAIANGDDPTIMPLIDEEIRLGKINPDRLLLWSWNKPSAHGFISANQLRISAILRKGRMPVLIEGKSPTPQPKEQDAYPSAEIEELVITFERGRSRGDACVAPTLAEPSRLVLGNHIKENMAAAALAALVFGVPPKVIQETFWNFVPGRHRIEWVDNVDGVDFYDDSKATNVDAVVRALQCFEGKRVWLLLGGRDKGGSYERLLDEAAIRCRGLCLFGEARFRIHEAIKGWNKAENDWEVVLAENLEEAFIGAAKRAEQGEVVLLSPACSSFDQYRSYAERGDHFKKLVAKWKSLRGK